MDGYSERSTNLFVFGGIGRVRLVPVSDGTWLSTDRRLSLIITMPQPSRSKTGKRKRPPEQAPSSLSLEVISIVRVGSGRGRATKKRIIETIDFDRPSSPITFPDNDDDDTPPAPDSPVDPSDSVGGESAELADATSRSVSVSVFCVRHVTRLPAFSRKCGSGCRTAQSSSAKSIAQKPLCIDVHPAFHANQLRSTVVRVSRLRSTGA